MLLSLFSGSSTLDGCLEHRKTKPMFIHGYTQLQVNLLRYYKDLYDDLPY